MKCRNCQNQLNHVFADLNTSPPSNSFLTESQLGLEETFFPLKVFVCNSCFLVQVDELKKADSIFNEDYIYFSSVSKAWLAHAEKYCDEMEKRFNLTNDSFVVEVASNDGYLLKNFKNKNIPCLGVEPTRSTATKSREIGIPTLEKFFGKSTSLEIQNEYGKADLIAGNNVVAHVPDIHDFIGGFKNLLKDDGVLTLEFPHLLELVKNNQFDTIYHEHFSYLSLHALSEIFLKNELQIFDIEKLSTHGGSLRIFVSNLGNSTHEPTHRVKEGLEEEKENGILSLDFYTDFQESINKVKNNALSYLINAKNKNVKVAAYAAAAKGNTFLNYSGIKKDLIPFISDASPHKQGKFLPGSQIPVFNIEKLISEEPDVVVVFAWNLIEEIISDLKPHLPNTEFVTFIPELKVYK